MSKDLMRFVLSIFAVLAVAVLAPLPSVLGQEIPAPAPPVTGRDWAPVVPIPAYQPETLPPVLLVDQDRTVHALVSLQLSDDPADPASAEVGIFYRKWTLQDGWTAPNDIMLTPVKQQARVKDAFLDDAGVIHMVFYGGDEQEAYTFYTWAPAADAASAQAWAPPFAVGPGATAPEIAGIVGDGKDQLMVVYGGNLGEGNSLYVIYSDDAGATWTEPQLLFSTYAIKTKPFDFSLQMGESGRVYLVWNVTDDSGQNIMGYFAKMDSLESKQWSQPMELDKNVGLGIAFPQVTEYNGNVMLIYNNGLEGQVPPVQWFRMSTDGGNTFDEPLHAFPTHIGRNGTVSFVEDSSDKLHVFFGQRIGGGFGDAIDLHGMWHATWLGSSWSPLTPVVSGPPSPSFDPYDANAVSVQGNAILLTFRTDPGREVSSTWYSYQVLDTPELPVVPLPTQAVSLALGRVVQPSAASDETSAVLAGELALAAEGGGELAMEPITGTGALSLRDLLPRPTPTAEPTPGPRPVFSTEPGAAAAASPAVPLLGAIVPTVLFVAAALLFGALRRKE
jgi:hypothetical protein